MGRTVGRADGQAATRLHGVSLLMEAAEGMGVDGGQGVRGWMVVERWWRWRW